MATNPRTPDDSDRDGPDFTPDPARAAEVSRDVSSHDDRDDAGPVDEAREHVRREDAVDRVREEAKRTRPER